MSVLLILLLLLYSIGSGVSKYPVRNLPGVDGPLPFELETGYVNIDQSNGIEWFYFFFKSENNPVEDPLLIWFSGGPGCSALNAVFFGNGPLKPKLEEYTGNVPPMELNPHGWTKVSNVLYVDAPTGAGFSYSTTVQGSYSNDTLSAKQSYTFIRMWLMDHKEFISNSVIIGGDSYAGMAVPIIVQNIAEGIEAGDQPLINLKGYLLGNPLTFPDSEKYFRIPFAYGMGLIPRELYESGKDNCQGDYITKFSSSVQCNMDLDVVEACLDRLWRSNILLPKCEDVVPENTIITDNIPKGPMFPIQPDHYFPYEIEVMKSSRTRLRKNSRNPIPSSPSLLPSMDCLTTYGYLLSYYWANNERVQDALNIRKGKTQTWLRCNFGINYTEDLDSRVPHHSGLSKRGIRSLIYSGDHDPTVPFMSTEAWIKSMNYSITDEWRPWIIDKKVAGYTRTYANNMTFATVKGGSHVAMSSNPKECLVMYMRWITYEPL